MTNPPPSYTTSWDTTRCRVAQHLALSDKNGLMPRWASIVGLPPISGPALKLEFGAG